MAIIGIDYYNTITRDPRLFRKLAAALLAAGDQVWIVSALKNPTNIDRKKEVLNCRVPHTGIELIYFTDYEEIPELKLQICKILGIRLMFDDMESVCEHLARNGIVTAQIRA